VTAAASVLGYAPLLLQQWVASSVDGEVGVGIPVRGDLEVHQQALPGQLLALDPDLQERSLAAEVRQADGLRCLVRSAAAER